MASATDLLKCPACGVQIKVTRPMVPSQVICPACHREVDFHGSERAAPPNEVKAFDAVASVEYRLSGEAIFPAAIEDCKARDQR